jgi:hypothetical protein
VPEPAGAIAGLVAYRVEPRDASEAPLREWQTDRAIAAGRQNQEGGPFPPPSRFPPALYAAPRDRGPSRGRTSGGQTRSGVRSFSSVFVYSPHVRTRGVRTYRILRAYQKNE